MPTSLTRRVTFSAAHSYRVAAWSDEQNEAAFGPWRSTHAHDYVCDVTVSGQVDPVAGFVVSLPALDAAIAREISDRFDHRNINVDVPEFAEGGMVPSGENLARFICERLQQALGGSARVTRVTVAEDDTLSATHEP